VSLRRHAAALAVAAFVIALPVAGQPAAVLRVCADPDNMPLSSDRATERGLYVDVAELVAAKLGLRVEYTWWHTSFGKRAVRSTLLSDRCDAFMGLPADEDFMPTVAVTRPFVAVGWAIITPPQVMASRLDDLDGRRVGVVFGSTPQMLVAQRDRITGVTFRNDEDALDALARGEVDAAFVWGPIAGYVNGRKLGGRYQVVSVAGDGLQWHAAIGVRKGDDALRARLNTALGELAPEIARRADAYGFPAPPKPAAARAAPPPALGQAGASSCSSGANANTGRDVFNEHCSHCHSPNAMSPEPSRDLRRLRLRYARTTRQVFDRTIADGRPEKGMPPWRGVLSAEGICAVWSFLDSVQETQ